MDIAYNPIIDKANAIGGAVIALATYFLGEHWIFFGAFLILNVIDYITGVAKSKILKKESSSAGLTGILKKFLYWIVIVLAFGMAPILNEIAELCGFDCSVISPMIGWFILCIFIINEIRSILENLVESGIQVPPILVAGFKVIADKLEATQETLIDGRIDITAKDETSDSCKTHIETPIEELREKDYVTLKIHTIHEDKE